MSSNNKKFDNFNEPRIIMLSGDIEEENLAEATKSLFTFALSNDNEPIYVIIDSFGGDVYNMLGFYDAMQAINAPIYTVCLSKAMSASVLLLAAGEKGHRKIGAHATLMIHPIILNSGGTIFDCENELNETKRLQEMLVDALVEE